MNNKCKYKVCKNGHAYTVANTKIDSRGHRNCRICLRKTSREYQRRKAEIARLAGKEVKERGPRIIDPEAVVLTPYKRSDLCRRCQMIGISCKACRELTLGRVRLKE